MLFSVNDVIILQTDAFKQTKKFPVYFLNTLTIIIIDHFFPFNHIDHSNQKKKK